MCRWRRVADTTYAWRGSAGFTLLEILVALCVVLLALVPLIHLHVVSIRTLDSSSHRAAATLLANDRLAEVLVQETSDLGQSSGRVEDANDGTVYRWTAVVTEARPAEVESVPLLGLRQVCVEVAWEDSGHEAVVSLDTYVYTPVAGERKILENQNGEKSNIQTTRPSRSAF
jgi:type II secretion system protein I